jgi:hypothetical protein
MLTICLFINLGNDSAGLGGGSRSYEQAWP